MVFEVKNADILAPNVSSSGDWYGAGDGIKVSGSTDETTLLTVTHPQTGSLMEVKASYCYNNACNGTPDSLLTP